MGEAYPGGRSCLEQAFRLRKIPETSINILIASITESTLKQYNQGFKLWWDFCSRSNIAPFSGDINIVLQFLSEMFSNGASYGTVNSVRSALSLLLSPTIGNDFRIKRFLKGVQNLRPITPKYNATWNPGIVLRYLEQLMPNHTLSLQVLTYKLITLLALVSAHRVQTLASIRIHNILVYEADDG
nr:unnamed protein product [Callosobruchus chinensis]